MVEAVIFSDPKCSRGRGGHVLWIKSTFSKAWNECGWREASNCLYSHHPASEPASVSAPTRISPHWDISRPQKFAWTLAMLTLICSWIFVRLAPILEGRSCCQCPKMGSKTVFLSKQIFSCWIYFKILSEMSTQYISLNFYNHKPL